MFWGLQVQLAGAAWIDNQQDQLDYQPASQPSPLSGGIYL